MKPTRNQGHNTKTRKIEWSADESIWEALKRSLEQEWWLPVVVAVDLSHFIMSMLARLPGYMCYLSERWRSTIGICLIVSLCEFMMGKLPIHLWIAAMNTQFCIFWCRGWISGDNTMLFEWFMWYTLYFGDPETWSLANSVIARTILVVSNDPRYLIFKNHSNN